MKFKCFFALLLLAMPGIVNAIPANPRIRTISNPDGSQVEVRVHGDEFFHFFTDAACTRILERDSRGFLVDAVRDGSPLMFNKEGVLRLKSESADGEICPSLSSRKSMQKMASLNSEGRTTYPTLGKGNRSIVVLVEFQDVAFTIENPKEYYTRQLNEPGFSDYGGCGSTLSTRTTGQKRDSVTDSVRNTTSRCHLATTDIPSMATWDTSEMKAFPTAPIWNESQQD